MSLAWYVVLERQLPNRASVTNGNALAHAAKAVDAIAKREGVQPLTRFFSLSLEEYSAVAESNPKIPKKSPQEKWFSASEGLRTVRMLIQVAAREGLDDRVVDDLVEFSSILGMAVEHGVRWHLGIDY